MEEEEGGGGEKGRSEGEGGKELAFWRKSRVFPSGERRRRRIEEGRKEPKVGKESEDHLPRASVPVR